MLPSNGPERRSSPFRKDQVERTITGSRNDRLNFAANLMSPTRTLPEIYGTFELVLQGLEQVAKSTRSSRQGHLLQYGEFLQDLCDQRFVLDSINIPVKVDDIGNLEASAAYTSRMENIMRRIITTTSAHKDLDKTQGYRWIRETMLGLDAQGNRIGNRVSIREVLADQYAVAKAETTKWMAWKQQMDTFDNKATFLGMQEKLSWILAEPAVPSLADNVTLIRSKSYEGTTLENLIAESQSGELNDALFSKITSYVSSFLADNESMSLFKSKQNVLAVILLLPGFFSGDESLTNQHVSFFRIVNAWHQRLWNEVALLGNQPGMHNQHFRELVTFFNNLISYSQSTETGKAILGGFLTFSLERSLTDPLKLDPTTAQQTDVVPETGYAKDAYDWFTRSSQRAYRDIIPAETMYAYASEDRLPAILRGINILNENYFSNGFGLAIGTLIIRLANFDEQFISKYRSELEGALKYPDTSLAQWARRSNAIISRAEEIRTQLIDAREIHYLPMSNREDTVTFPSESMPSYMGFETISFVNTSTETDWNIEFQLAIKGTNWHFRGRITPEGMLFEPPLSEKYKGFEAFARLIVMTTFHELVTQDPARIEVIAEELPDIPETPPIELQPQDEIDNDDEEDKKQKRKVYARELPRRRSNDATKPRVIMGSDLIAGLEPKYQEVRSLSPHPRKNYNFIAYQKAVNTYNDAVAQGITDDRLNKLAQEVRDKRRSAWKTSVGKKQTFPAGFEVSVVDYPFSGELENGDDGRDYSHTWVKPKGQTQADVDDRLFKLRRESRSGLLQLDQFVLDLFSQE